MFKGRDVIGKPVVSYDDGKKFDVVEDLIFDQESHQLLGFLVQEAGWFRPAQVLLLSDVQAIGTDAVITASQEAIVKNWRRETNGPDSCLPAVRQILDHNTILRGTRILTLDGRNLGVIVDLYFDETTGQVEGYEVSGGLFADAYSGRSFVPAIQTLKIGRDVAFVPSQTAQLMEEQVGGLRGAMQTVSDRVQSSAQVTGDRLQELGQTVGDRVQETAQLTNEHFQNLGHYASEKALATAAVAETQLHGLSRATTHTLTNAIIDPAGQKAYVTGSTLERDVITPTGSLLALQGQTITHEIADAAEALGVLDDLYRAAGGSWSVPLGARVEQAVAGLTVEQARGRRVRHLVRTEAGSILAAPGQIVTPQVIDRAKAHHRDRLLLEAVGLSAGAAQRTDSAMTAASDRLQSTTAADQFQAGARSLWSQVQETTIALQQRSTRAIEDQQIKHALGRPVTRVILGQQDEVILNVGELITHRAIASARQALVLDVLLNSVYTGKPQLSLEKARAPQAGIAAL
ncbi:PRC-barrel domain-containing protein [Leptolyngbya sp. CCNP1308]|uniref:PRC-barrel domain-containing protein n=1 Tax=Leptolyngbya sp. CCNP1308 TaxID=3110255 RepID=UPI002B1F8E43|nr:PRC-barrel domain-containing protein [Leptolyngbya sp. CCNP1308]MEA5451588.1 PRC-barrel domain-containing protein [Leptolyngbya sp. CCNP1308]